VEAGRIQEGVVLNTPEEWLCAEFTVLVLKGTNTACSQHSTARTDCLIRHVLRTVADLI